MTTTNHHPVDSTFYDCCSSIGQHAADCTAANLSDSGDSMPTMTTTTVPNVPTPTAADGRTDCDASWDPMHRCVRETEHDGNHACLCSETTANAVPVYVRIVNLVDDEGDHPPITCRADAIAEILLASGWFGVLPDLIAPELQRTLLAGQRTDVMESILDIAIRPYTGSVPIPAGTVSVDEWALGGRLFCGSTSVTVEASGWLREDVRITTGGAQNDDGSYGWEIMAGPIHPDSPLTAAQARQIGEALLAAAAELDDLNSAATR